MRTKEVSMSLLWERGGSAAPARRLSERLVQREPKANLMGQVI